ncbi:MAG: hypothetical protein ACRENO_10605 [Thermodesulfobacteriota bacterium]
MNTDNLSLESKSTNCYFFEKDFKTLVLLLLLIGFGTIDVDDFLPEDLYILESEFKSSISKAENLFTDHSFNDSEDFYKFNSKTLFYINSNIKDQKNYFSVILDFSDFNYNLPSSSLENLPLSRPPPYFS